MTSSAHIVSAGTALPGPAIDNHTLAKAIGASAEWIDVFIGTHTRHFAVDLATGIRTATVADLAAEAARKAMDAAGVTAYEIDYIVLATAAPDELMPATVNRVADRLGVNLVPTYQLQSGCAGAVQALDLGALLLSRPEHTTGLVIGADVCVKHLDLRQDFSALVPAELVNYVLFGDGAGAVVLRDEPAPGGLVVHQVLNQLTGQGQAPGQIIRWFGEADRDSELKGFEEDYKAIERRVPVMAAEILEQLLEQTGWVASDLAYALPPQLAGRMTAKIFEGLDLPGVTEISCVADTGNNGNALLFFQLARLIGTIGPGERAVAICVESSKWIKGGFTAEGC